MLNFISNWVKLILGVYIFITIVELVLPSNSFKKYAKFVMGLIVLVTILMPVSYIITKGFNVEDSINKYLSYFDTSTEATKVGEKYNQEIINQFKQNLLSKLQLEIDRNFMGKYNISKIEINENLNSVKFGQIEKIVLKRDFKNIIEPVDKVVIGSSKNEGYNDFENKEVVKFLKDYYNIEKNSIEFEK